MDPSLNDLHLFWLILRWGFPLLGIALLTHHFILNYFHERGEEMAAMAKLVRRPGRQRGGGDRVKRANTPKTRVLAPQTPAPGRSDRRKPEGSLASIQSDDAPA